MATGFPANPSAQGSDGKGFDDHVLRRDPGGLGLRSFAPSRLRRRTPDASAFLGEPPPSRVRNRTARRAAYRRVASLKKPALRLLKCVDYAQAFASNLQRDWN